MAVSSGRGLPVPGKGESWAAYCAAIPGALLSTNALGEAGAALELALQAAGGGLIPGLGDSPDSMANLWFMRAAHLYFVAGGDKQFFNEKLLPFSKKIVQEFIAPGGIGGVIMDDGGLLVPPHDSIPDASPALALHWGLRLNALWYSGLETTGINLKTIGDRSGDHYERLAGRFRRSFAKSFWCDAHTCVCIPEEKNAEGHAEHPPSLDPDQLLLTLLPASPIPRTKQRQVLQVIRAGSLGALGVRMEHPIHGSVESILHRAWIVSGLLASADARNTALPEATEIATTLMNLLGESRDNGICALYKDGQPLGQPDLLTTAEVEAAIALLRAT